ncbi:hypothetical protein [Sinisalibacter aestuarii]|uniref:PH domain-containing protein n=1 Tax=Sinisalibacter aestuarii TaxID=2949426 RepID=A0ABQ5LTS5_9RHOB|nr:hypothetical protein [Sinisalibacter aestuarii]GKY88397.1 hypothetical protein STA1M1_22660 [Sinisalibacter aestuarii]
MDQFDFYPAPKSLKKSVIFGLFYLGLGTGFWRILSTSDAGIPTGGTVVAGLFCLTGANALVRGLRGLARPTPCFSADANGFSVMGKRTRRWEELADIRIRRIRIYGLISIGTWVSLRVKKNGRGLTRRVEIPWSHLPDTPEETAAAILQAALLAGWQPRDARAARTLGTLISTTA